jgi:hypothetical protein
VLNASWGVDVMEVSSLLFGFVVRSRERKEVLASWAVSEGAPALDGGAGFARAQLLL